MENKCCCSKRHTERSEAEYKKLVNRLSRIEGQLRGVRKMLEEDAYCIDILTQVAATNAALSSLSREILSRHIHTCVIRDIKEGNDQASADELVDILKKFMK
ncbi:MAG: metal-sensing transcriptional repressor [Sphaerochaetaceae bacterium]|nr:metal-sensing transcriptional repressor [Sphaerochaetaceae bacterium]